MNVVVLGAGIIGVSTAWHLLARGHEVTLVDRQPGAALETSFANAAQISVSYCEPWAHRDAPRKALQWMLRHDAPLLFRPQLDVHQWRWGWQFLAQCNDAAFERNVQQLVALGAYSHAALKALVQATGIEYHRLERGIAHYYTDSRAFDTAGEAATLMQKYGVARRVVNTAELLAIEPALQSFCHRIVGGTYTASDESGDARLFTQALAERCARRGARFLYSHAIERLEQGGSAIESVVLRPVASAGEAPSSCVRLVADAVVLACGAHSAPLLRSVGISLPIYPGKGYSATFALRQPDRAPFVSMIDDEVKCAMSRLGNQLRVAGTIELGGYDLTLDTPLARARCKMLADRVEAVLPGVCDTRLAKDGGQPHFWSGLRPATPTNIPYIGKTRLGRLWVNAGHGTLGWTHGAGSGQALAALMSGEIPQIGFHFYGFPAHSRQLPAHAFPGR